MKIPLPSPEERAARERQHVLAKAAAVKESIEQVDPRGAILALLSAVGFAHKAVPATDVANRRRIEAMAEGVLDAAGTETLGVRSAQRMVDRLIEAVDTDWVKRGL